MKAGSSKMKVVRSRQIEAHRFWGRGSLTAPGGAEEAGRESEEGREREGKLRVLSYKF